MKRIIYLVPLLGLLYACSGEQKHTEKENEEIKEQIVTLEESIEELDESLKSSDLEMENSQGKIDSLLIDI